MTSKSTVFSGLRGLYTAGDVFAQLSAVIQLIFLNSCEFSELGIYLMFSKYEFMIKTRLE